MASLPPKLMPAEPDRTTEKNKPPVLGKPAALPRMGCWTLQFRSQDPCSGRFRALEGLMARPSPPDSITFQYQPHRAQNNQVKAQKVLEPKIAQEVQVALCHIHGAPEVSIYRAL